MVAVGKKAGRGKTRARAYKVGHKRSRTDGRGLDGSRGSRSLRPWAGWRDL